MEIVFRAAGHLRTACRVPVAAARVTAIVRIPRSRENCTSTGGFEGRLGVVVKSERERVDRWVRGSGRARRIPFHRLLCVLSGVATSRRRLRRLENLSDQALFYTYYTLHCMYLSGRWRRCVCERLNPLESSCQHYFFSPPSFLSRGRLILTPSRCIIYILYILYINEIPPKSTVYTNS